MNGVGYHTVVKSAVLDGAPGFTVLIKQSPPLGEWPVK